MSFSRTTRLPFLALVCPLAASLAVMLTACPDPQGQFDAFAERDCAIKGGTIGEDGSCSAGQGGGGGMTSCPLPLAAEADGVYMFALSANLDPPKAFALDATVVTHIDGDATTVDLTLQPLSKEDQTTEVGEPIVFTGLEVSSDGSFEWDLGEITLISEANPLSPSEVVSSLALHGSLCGGEEALGFVCGDAAGIVVTPIPDHDLVGSTFAMARYDMGGDKPAPVINCAKDPAVY